MPRRTSFELRFVEFVPDQVEEGVLYISIEYTTVVHKCYCGCGNQVVTPLAPVFWELTFDGEAVSLFPSVGSWSFPCRSHYWIVRNQVVESWPWTDDEIAHARGLDARGRREYFGRRFRGEVMHVTAGSTDDERE
jgi:hypothetical protein